MTIARRFLAFASALAVGGVCGAAVAKPATGSASKRLALDSAFGDRGVASFTNLGTQSLDRFDAIATDWLGLQIYVAGSRPVLAVARFDRRGAPDPTFGTGGVAVLPVGGVANGILATNGIVLYGSFSPPAGSDLPSGAVRILADGSGLDPAFGTGGLLSLDSIPTGGTRATLRSAAQSPVDGSSVASVWWNESASPAAGLIRFSKDGVLDGSFGGDGLVELALSDRFDTTRSLAVDSLGRTIVAISGTIERFNADGTRDMSFGTDGVLLDPDGAVAFPLHLAATQDDGIVAVVSRSRARGLAVCYWKPDGTLLPNFGRGGHIDLPARLRGGLVGNAFAMALVPALGGVFPGDRVFLAGGATFGGDTDPRQRGGWYGELVEGNRPRLVRTRVYRNTHTWVAEQIWITGVVCTPSRAFAIGNRSTWRATGGTIESPFLVSFVLDR